MQNKDRNRKFLDANRMENHVCGILLPCKEHEVVYPEILNKQSMEAKKSYVFTAMCECEIKYMVLVARGREKIVYAGDLGDVEKMYDSILSDEEIFANMYSVVFAKKVDLDELQKILGT